MARAMWRGAIQFGLVTIPVKLYLATESKGINFNMLHAECRGRIQMKTYCPTDDEMIGRNETVRGYEYSPGEYVVITDEDLASVPLKTVRAIEIEQFVPVDTEGDSTRFIKQAYYLEPEPVARKAFYLLKQVLAEKELRAICKIVLKDREHLAALDPFASTMLLSTLYWPDEVRALGELSLPEAEIEIKPAERAMAEQLVTAMTGEFDATSYRDEYRDALMGVIEAKVSGVEVAAPAPVQADKVTDLMAALQASVNAARAERGETAEAPRATRSAKPRKVAVASGGQGDEEEAEPELVVPARKRKTA